MAPRVSFLSFFIIIYSASDTLSYKAISPAAGFEGLRIYAKYKVYDRKKNRVVEEITVPVEAEVYFGTQGEDMKSTTVPVTLNQIAAEALEAQ